MLLPAISFSVLSYAHGNTYIFALLLLLLLYAQLQFDRQLKSHFIFIFADSTSVTLHRMWSWNGIVLRGAAGISPLLVVWIGTANWTTFALVQVLFIISVGVASAVSPRGVEADRTTTLTATKVLDRSNAQRVYFIWHCAFQAAVNLPFAGIGAAIIFADYPAGPENASTALTVLAIGVTVATTIALVFDPKIMHDVPLKAYKVFLVGMSIIVWLMSMARGYGFLWCCVGLGVMFGTMSVVVAPSIARQLRGPRYVTYQAQATAIGRAATITSTMLVGSLHDLGIQAQSLFLCSAICGLVGFAFLAGVEHLVVNGLRSLGPSR
jgi:hypothetical protein